MAFPILYAATFLEPASGQLILLGSTLIALLGCLFRHWAAGRQRKAPKLPTVTILAARREVLERLQERGR